MFEGLLHLAGITSSKTPKTTLVSSLPKIKVPLQYLSDNISYVNKYNVISIVPPKENGIAEFDKININTYLKILKHMLDVNGLKHKSIKGVVNKLQLGIMVNGSGVYTYDKNIPDDMFFAIDDLDIDTLEQKTDFLCMELTTDGETPHAQILTELNSSLNTHVRYLSEDNSWDRWFKWNTTLSLPLNYVELIKNMDMMYD